jgi:hypothetical protein
LDQILSVVAWPTDSKKIFYSFRQVQAHLTNIGVPFEKKDELLAHIKKLRDQGEISSIGFFSEVTEAKRALDQWLSSNQEWKIIGVGIESTVLPDFMKQAADYPENAIANALQKKRPLPIGGKTLGYDVGGFENDGMFCSFLCNGLEVEARTKLGFNVNAFGLAPNFQSALKLTSYCTSTEPEPLNYFPFILVDYT